MNSLLSNLAPSSFAELLQTVIQFLTLIGIVWYTWITRATFYEINRQNKSIQAQLTLQREESWQKAEPIISWIDDNYAIMDTERTLSIIFHCRLQPIFEINTRTTDLRFPIETQPADYLEADKFCTLIIPQEAIKSLNIFFSIEYSTTAGVRTKRDFQMLGTHREGYADPIYFRPPRQIRLATTEQTST